MFAFFVSLIIQALNECEVRNKMKEMEIESLPIYPEEREAVHPTTTKILRLFEEVFTYKLVKKDRIIEEFRDDLTETQKHILQLLDITEEHYWCS